MVCDSCGAENLEGARFCTKCGNSLFKWNNAVKEEPGPIQKAPDHPEIISQPVYQQPESKGFAILCYIGLTGWMISFLSRGKSDRLVYHHLNQALMLDIITEALMICIFNYSLISLPQLMGEVLFYGLFIPAVVLLLAVRVWGIVLASLNSKYPIPILTKKKLIPDTLVKICPQCGKTFFGDEAVCQGCGYRRKKGIFPIVLYCILRLCVLLIWSFFGGGLFLI